MEYYSDVKKNEIIDGGELSFWVRWPWPRRISMYFLSFSDASLESSRCVTSRTPTEVRKLVDVRQNWGCAQGREMEQSELKY